MRPPLHARQQEQVVSESGEVNQDRLAVPPPVRPQPTRATAGPLEHMPGAGEFIHWG